MKKNTTVYTFFLAWALVTMFIAPNQVIAADEEGCMICHKYSGLARLDKTGKTRLFYVNNDTYNNTVHGKVLCRNCHLNLDVIPHTDAKKVDCSTKCHIKEPSTDVEFSHGNLYAEVNASIHGKTRSEGELKKNSNDMPGCTDCHYNTVYKPVHDSSSQQEGIALDSLRRCIGCHTDKDWSKRYYQHFTHRLHASKTPVETVNLCLNCHQDESMMIRHGLPAATNYRDTYHWKGVLYGDKDSPNCISCHAPVGYSVHSLKGMHDKASPVNSVNLQRTCINEEGAQECHPNAVASFANQGKVHQTGLGFEETVAAFVQGKDTLDEISALKKERRFRALMSDIDEAELSAMNDKELFQIKVYMLVKYVYTLLITVVIGGMLIHQLMDFYRTVQNRKMY